jgi:hypothetical protein
MSRCTVNGSAVGSYAAAAGAVRGSASRGGAAAGRKVTHAAPGVLALAYFCGFRFRRIQRVRVDVRRPYSRREQKPSHNHNQTKTARSQLRHLIYSQLVCSQLGRISYLI